MLTRRSALLSTAAALTAGVLSAETATAAATRPARTSRGTGTSHPTGSLCTDDAPDDRIRLRLPAPTGPFAVGTVSVRLVDPSRPDPWQPGRPHRELMAGFRYPARRTEGHRAAPHMLPGAAASFARSNSLQDIPAERVDWAATRTHACEGAPVARHHSPFPVVLYSAGAGDPRTLGTVLCDELASQGFVVVTLDHTYDAGAVEFRGGRVEEGVLRAEYARTGGDPARVRALMAKVLDVRVADTRFVLDTLERAAYGGCRTRGAQGREWAQRLAGVLDLGRTGMAGQSAGGFTALQTMHDDHRLKAGADLDGVLAHVQEDSDPGYYAPVAVDGLDRPFLLMGMDGNEAATVPSWRAVLDHSTGWRRGVMLRGTQHASYTDAEALVPQLARALGLPARTVEKNIGTLRPGQALAAQRAYVTAFFDRTLRGGDDGGLFDGPSARFPQARLFA